MNRQEAIREACDIVGLAYHSVGDYSHASDGFCDECEKHQSHLSNYSNQGTALDYVRKAVLNQLKADGFEIDHRFDPGTGKEMQDRVYEVTCSDCGQSFEATIDEDSRCPHCGSVNRFKVEAL